MKFKKIFCAILCAVISINLVLPTMAVKAAEVNLDIATMTASPSNQAISGWDSVTISTKASGGAGSYTYTYWVVDQTGRKVYLEQDISSASITWTPVTPQTYQINVEVRDESGQKSRAWINGYKVVKAELATDLSVTPTDGAIAGKDTVTVRASVTGGTGPYTYTYWVVDRTGRKVYLAQNVSSASITWTPVTPQTYQIHVEAKDQSGKIGRASIKEYQVVPKTVDISSLTVSPEGGAIGGKDAVTIQCSAIGGTGPYTYTYWVVDQTGRKVYLAKNSSSSSFTWKPITPQTYQINVEVKDKAGSTTQAWMNGYTVRKESFTSSLSVTPTVGAIGGKDTVTIQCSATGGTGPYTYTYWVVDQTGRKVYLAKNSSGSSFTWKPITPQTYQINVETKDQQGNVSTAKIDGYQVAQKATDISSMTVDPEDGAAAGKDTVIVQTVATGGIGTLTYTYWVTDPTGSKVYLTRNSTDSFCTWKPITPKTYQINVEVKDQAGNTTRAWINGYTVKKTSLNTSVSVTPPGGANAGKDTVKVNASVTGGTAPYTYTYWVVDQTGRKVYLDQNSTSAFCTWTPSTPQVYEIHVAVKDRMGAIGRAEVTSYDVVKMEAQPGLNISSTKQTVSSGKTLYLLSDNGGSNAIWKSSNPQVAAVSSVTDKGQAVGFIEAKAPGTAIITVTNAANTYYAQCTVTVTESEPIRYAYTSPNIVAPGAETTFVAVTDQTRTQVRFKLTQNGTVSYHSAQKVSEENTYKWTANVLVSATGVSEVVAESYKDGIWSTCAAGKTDVFVSNTVSTSSSGLHRVSDKGLAFIGECEGMSGDVYMDTFPSNPTPTIGMGYVIYPNGAFYNHLTATEQKALLSREVNQSAYSAEMNRFIQNNALKCDQQQFDAMVSFSYNMGTGWILNNWDVSCLLKGQQMTAVCQTEVNLNVRKTPVTGEVIGSLAPGQTVTLLSSVSYGPDKNWYRVILDNGKEGYVCYELNGDQYLSKISYSASVDEMDFGMIATDPKRKAAFIASLGQFHHSGGDCVPGLLYRRFDELNIFFKGDYTRYFSLSDFPDYTPPYCYIAR